MDLDELPVFSVLENGRRVDEAVLRVFLDQALRNEQKTFFRSSTLEVATEANPHVVDYILEQEIVVERSPAEGIRSLNSLRVLPLQRSEHMLVCKRLTAVLYGACGHNCRWFRGCRRKSYREGFEQSS
jgi:hypothetical protein